VENTNEYFDAWMKSQTQAFTTLREQGERMLSFYQAIPISTKKPFDMWRDAVLKALSSGVDGNAMQDTMFKAFTSTDAMQKLYELWQPVFLAMQNQSFNAGQSYVDPAKIKQMLDQLFNFDSSAITQMQEQASQFMTAYQKFSKPWSDAVAANMGMMPQAAEGNPQALFNMFQNMSNVLNNNAGQLFNVPKVGKDREKSELLSRFIESLSLYAKCNAEYQQAMYKTGSSAMQQVVEKLVAKAQAGDTSGQDFNAFFELWIESNEKTFNKFFQTKEFSRLRDAMTSSGFAARKHYFALVELQLADLPIALRSEMDDLYKTIYELRKEVKNLKAQINASSAKDSQS
jgi:hypothetical protein